MVKNDADEGSGFARYRQESGTILLPLATIAALKAEAAIALEAEDIAAEEEAAFKKTGSYRNCRAQTQNTCSKSAQHQAGAKGR